MLTSNVTTANQAFSFYTPGTVDSTVFVNPGATQIGNTVLSFNGGSIPFSKMVDATTANTYQYSALMLENFNNTANLTCVTSPQVTNIKNLKYPTINPTTTAYPLSPVGLFLFYFDGTSRTLLNAVKTAQGGGAGLQGSTGVLGQTGVLGNTGIQGINGEDGAQGIQGDPGVQGDPGIQGVTGFRGVTGVGTTGIQGPQGIQGTAGPIGLMGPIGPKGATGIQGAEGSIGPMGPSGPEGPMGPQGFTGVSVIPITTSGINVTVAKGDNARNTALPTFNLNPTPFTITKVGQMGLISGSFSVTIPIATTGKPVGNLYEILLTFPNDYFVSAFAMGYPISHFILASRSTTSRTITNVGSVSFTLNYSVSVYVTGQRITAAYDKFNKMTGVVTSYVHGTGALTISVNSSTGSGTYASWQIAYIDPFTPIDYVVIPIAANTLKICASQYYINYMEALSYYPIEHEMTYFNVSTTLAFLP